MTKKRSLLEVPGEDAKRGRGMMKNKEGERSSNTLENE